MFNSIWTLYIPLILLSFLCPSLHPFTFWFLFLLRLDSTVYDYSPLHMPSIPFSFPVFAILAWSNLAFFRSYYKPTVYPFLWFIMTNLEDYIMYFLVFCPQLESKHYEIRKFCLFASFLCPRFLKGGWYIVGGSISIFLIAK